MTLRLMQLRAGSELLAKKVRAFNLTLTGPTLSFSGQLSAHGGSFRNGIRRTQGAKQR
mgnify:CR=1 FL=1